MPHFPNTPEALLGRNDSKNPASTCKGITSAGRPCRRALASPNARRNSNGSALNGVVAIVQQDGHVQEAGFYCWQHKGQAEQRVEEEKKDTRRKKRATELFPLQERSSIDTLVQRLGIDAAAESPAKDKKARRESRNPRPPRKTETTDFASTGPSQAPYAEKYNFRAPNRRDSRPKKRGFWASLCCMTGGDDDYVEIVRHKKRVEQGQQPEMSFPVPKASSRPPKLSTLTHTSTPPRNIVNTQQARPGAQQPSPSNPPTNEYLSLIPQTLSSQTTSALLVELIKPISPYDEEGYIYIFWLTPQANTAPPESTARSLLSPERPTFYDQRRISDVMTEFSYDGSETGNTRSIGNDADKSKKVMLKVGRANNVTRRMNEWQRQCGYKLNLVRWYPYVSSTPQPSPNRERPTYPDLSKPPPEAKPLRESEVVHKVPYVKRVERLIHLELAEKQVKRQCSACGKEHREWFEVEASQVGVKGVDDVVKRWVGWSEREVDRRESQ